KKGSPVRMVYDKKIPEDLLLYLLKRMKLRRNDSIIPGGRYHNHKDFMDFPEIGESHHYYQSTKQLPNRYLPPHRSILKKISQRDIILHYPYQNFYNLINLIREAAIDPNVKEIAITLYRVATYSKIVNTLLNAARNGKKVTVIIELQARFDEEANIYWSNKLQEEGVQVINGVLGLKVHSKLALISRLEEGKMKYYAYIGTGNFHEGTARIYADEGLFTSDPRISNEVAKVFEFFKHNYKHFIYEHLIVSPFRMREFFEKLIDKEIALARVGKPAYMIIKMNSLVDPGMIDKLYDASIAGVQIKLIIRGACSLIPGIPGLSDNIYAISIVDKYLEHSRILLFGNGGNERLFISSADWMPRNLNRRIEVACPIYDSEIKRELKAQLEIQLKDNQKARILDYDLSNRYCRTSSSRKIRSQEEYYNYLRNIHNPDKKTDVPKK
ncbi:MAG: polyphosphate kinase 1, partial [Bacteroidota bacterium]|nr:polyphosphate kinase 1 [Bacteroidota bacterium]